MTKVQLAFRLEKPLDEEMMGRLAQVHAVYGIQKIKPSATLDAITVEYDATRMRPAEVGAALKHAGIPVQAADTVR
jgi:hypothetical protein